MVLKYIDRCPANMWHKTRITTSIDVVMSIISAGERSSLPISMSHITAGHSIPRGFHHGAVVFVIRKKTRRRRKDSGSTASRQMGMLRCCLSARKPRITIQGVTSVPGPRWASSEPEGNMISQSPSLFSVMPRARVILRQLKGTLMVMANSSPSLIQPLNGLASAATRARPCAEMTSVSSHRDRSRIRCSGVTDLLDELGKCGISRLQCQGQIAPEGLVRFLQQALKPVAFGRCGMRITSADVTGQQNIQLLHASPATPGKSVWVHS